MNDSAASVIDVDARGLRCPEPVMVLRAALRTAAPGARLRLLADDPSTTRDIPRFCSHVGHRLVSQTESGGVFTYLVERSA